MELIQRALPFAIALELLELIVRLVWPALVSPDTFWALVAGASAFLFLNGIFAPGSLRPYDIRSWLSATVPAYWLVMVLHALGTGAILGMPLQTTLVGVLAQGMTMVGFVTLLARVPTLPAGWQRHPLVLTVLWLVGSLIMVGLWLGGVQFAAAVWGLTSEEGLALAGGLATLLYALWNLVCVGLSYLRQPHFFRAY